MPRNFFLIILLFSSSIFPYEGYPVSLVDHVIQRSYESKSDGTDSFVLEVSGLKNLYEEVLSSKKPVIAKFFVSNSKQLTDLFQNIAENFNNKLKFVSINVTVNQVMMKQIVEFFMKLTMELQSRGQEGLLLVANVMGVMKRILALEQEKEPVPFVLFFNGENLFFPKLEDISNIKLFSESLEGFVSQPETHNYIHFFSKDEQKLSLWKKIKFKFRKWWNQ